MDNKDVGILLNGNNIKLHRQYFKQTIKLIGINVIYRAPMENKTWDGYGELDSSFYPPEIVGCLFTEHPNQKTLKKLGWVAELQENSSIIEVPYDLKNLQQGSLFIIPSGLDNAKGRVFKVVGMESIAVYPSTILCEIIPVYENRFDRSQLQHTDNDMNILLESNSDNDGSNFMYLSDEKEDKII
jgi:hypothetical protein